MKMAQNVFYKASDGRPGNEIIKEPETQKNGRKHQSFN